MSVPLPGYTTTRLLRSSARARVAEARRESDGLPIVAKIFHVGDPAVEARAEHEFRLIHELEVEGVVRALGLERAGDELVLLLERVPGVNLEEHTRGRTIDVSEFLRLAIELAAILARIHERRIVHRDIKPSNLLIDPSSGRVYFADFGISVLLENERRHLYDPDVVEGTLPYISPEQTGRTQREVDFRSDLYSLGASFYELLTGRRPFSATAPLELIHAHLARRPQPPHERRPDLPRLLSAIVMKLLEKAPEHRYQSAQGLRADLERLQAALEAGEREPEFSLAEHDVTSVLQMPHQLYGRERELAVLDAVVGRAVSERQTQVVVLSGEPGIGKSALLRELDGPLAARDGYLAIGRFVQLERDQPYRGFVEAIDGLAGQLLTESEERLAAWRTRLRDALGSLAPVVVELLPELALVLGDNLPEFRPLEPGEAKNRLHLAVARLLLAFAELRPLVLALDDLHWADPSSLELLRSLALGSEGGSLLIVAVIGSDVLRNHSSTSEVLLELLDDLDQLGERLHHLEPGPLAHADVTRMLSEMLGRSPDQLRELVEIVARKTDNKPLFVRQFVRHIADLGLLRATPSGWTWDREAIAAAGLPDHVLGLMHAKLERLGQPLRELLQRAACIGSSFELSLLERIVDVRGDALVANLHRLESEGLIAATHRAYQFSHEQIRQAALERLSVAERRRLHWAIGMELLALASLPGAERTRVSPPGDTPRRRPVVASAPVLADEPLPDPEPGSVGGLRFGERVFEIVDQLDAGIDLDDPAAGLEPEQALLLARINLEAGQRAMGTAAWELGRRYLALAATLIQPWVAEARGGRGERSIAFAIHFAHAQALALASQREAAERAFDALLGWELPTATFGRVVGRHIRILALQERMSEAVRAGLSGLARCGIALPERVRASAMVLATLRAWRAYRSLDAADLRALPDMRDERAIAAMHIIAALKGPAFVDDRNLFLVLAALHAQLTLRHGFHPISPIALAQFGISVAYGLRKPGEAGSMCDVAFELFERVPQGLHRPQMVSAACLFVWPCTRPFRTLTTQITAAQQQALEQGDLESSGYLAAIGLTLHIAACTHLREVQQLGAIWIGQLEHWGTQEMQVLADTSMRLVARMVASDDDTPSAMLTRAQVTERGGSLQTVCAAMLARMLCNALEGRWAEVLAEAEAGAKDFHRISAGNWNVPRFVLLHALALAEHCVGAVGKRRWTIRRRIRRQLAILREWAAIGPANFAAGADLVAAELAALTGRDERAAVLFEQARAQASDAGQYAIVGLGCSRLASFADRRGRVATASGARRLAHDAYRLWGATELVRQLEREHPELFGLPGELPERASMSTTRRIMSTPSSDTSALALDVATVLGTLQAISEELRLDEVITRVLGSAIENAGADRGALLLEREGVIGLVAAGSSTSATEFFATPLSLRDAADRLPVAVLNFVLRTGKALVLDDAQQDSRFAGDPYIAAAGVRSLLCMPIVKQHRRVGALVLENRLNSHGFTAQRLEVLSILVGQAASALDNARLYDALQRSEAQWRSLVDGVPDVISLLDERGRVEFINHLDPYDVEIDQLVGQPAELFMEPGGSAEAWRQAFAEVLSTSELRELEVRLMPPNEAPRWYMIRLAPIALGGRVGKVISIATDVTERKRAEDERTRLEAQLRQQQRLESIGTLASGVAHEINNPVQGILNYAELISERSSDAVLVEEFAREIGTESQRVATIVRNLLAFSRQEREVQHEAAQVGKLIDATLSLIRAVIRKDQIQLEVDIAEDLPRVRCRPQQIQQILMNLITNARDALNERWGEFSDDKRIELRARAHTHMGRTWVRISVVDWGGGIPADIRSRIFDPFFTTKGRDKGTGLGLAVSHGIAAEHGGELSVESEMGVGSTFHLDLPAVREV